MTKQKALQSYRNLAQKVTVGAAVVTGILWILGYIMQVGETSALVKTQDYLVAITVAGGIVMGILYFISKSDKK